jgi:hypothetical protein
MLLKLYSIADINTSVIAKTVSSNPDKVISFLTAHWQDILLQYIGILTAAIFGLLLAVTIPTIGEGDTFKLKKLPVIFRILFLLLSLCWEMWSLSQNSL